MRGVAVTLACFALIAVLLAWSRWLARRRLASLGHLALAAVCTVGAAFLWVLADGLATYDPLRPGVAVAELRFDDAGPGRYRATLIRLPEGRVQVFELPGERWRIEARTLAWRGPAASAGLRSGYRLERIESGPVAGTAGRSYDLAESAGVDVWARARGGPPWSRYAEAGVAEAPWQPMTSGAEYRVAVAGGELVIEPVDDGGPVLAPAR